MDIFINAANILYVIAYFTTDMLRLRLFTLVAACCLAVYFYCQPVPMLNVVAWNLFFIALNVAQVARILARRHAQRRPHGHRQAIATGTELALTD
jgi:hypothetical protein